MFCVLNFVYSKLYAKNADFNNLHTILTRMSLLHLPPLRFHCVEGCWDRTPESCDFGIASQTL
jgi:hypothetical protein